MFINYPFFALQEIGRVEKDMGNRLDSTATEIGQKETARVMSKVEVQKENADRSKEKETGRIDVRG